ncbi:hypothetical protein ACH4VM_32920 [Streptomyces sp. NPDC020792]|uniref:hypothetical protein n=1 Tax=Streptomyces sp. NPDC020792 TaxID=3365089 RepID=UPI00378E7E9A
MAHAAPVSGITTRTTRPPNLFSARAHAIGRWAGPLALGLVYGYWAAADRRDGGPITGWNVLFGFVTTIVFTVVLAGVLMLGPRLRREQHAALWFAFIGVAFGFLYSQSGHALVSTVGLSLGIAIVAGLFCFYWFYTHEDAAGRRVS